MQREIIREFQQLHLAQQAAERAFLDKNKLKCKELDQFHWILDSELKGANRL